MCHELKHETGLLGIDDTMATIKSDSAEYASVCAYQQVCSKLQINFAS